MKNKISIIIYTYNEENNIKLCIKSAQLLIDNIIVIDMESTDNTVSLAKKNGANVYSFPFSYYVEPAREFGINQAKTDWVFILDADERITEELKTEIANRTQAIAAYKIPRKNIFGKTKWLRHGGWWPDYQIRLINKQSFKGWPKAIHSTPLIEDEIGHLKTPLLHYFHGDFEKMVDKTIIFENIEADLLYKAGRRSDTLIFFRKFVAELYRRLIKNFGFLDGNIGIMESIYQAFSKTITYLYLYEKKKSSSI